MWNLTENTNLKSGNWKRTEKTWKPTKNMNSKKWKRTEKMWKPTEHMNLEK